MRRISCATARQPPQPPITVAALDPEPLDPQQLRHDSHRPRVPKRGPRPCHKAGQRPTGTSAGFTRNIPVRFISAARPPASHHHPRARQGGQRPPNDFADAPLVNVCVGVVRKPSPSGPSLSNAVGPDSSPRRAAQRSRCPSSAPDRARRHRRRSRINHPNRPLIKPATLRLAVRVNPVNGRWPP